MACVLCGSMDDPTDEDVIPKWMLRASDVQQGSTTLNVSEEAGDKHGVKRLKRFRHCGHAASRHFARLARVHCHA